MTSGEPIFRPFEIHGVRRLTLGKKAWTTDNRMHGLYNLFRAQSGEWRIIWSPPEGGPDQLIATFGANYEPEAVVKAQQIVESHDEMVRARRGGGEQMVPVVRGRIPVPGLVEQRKETVSSFRKASVAASLYEAKLVMIDGPVMLVYIPRGICRIELLGNGQVRFDHKAGRETTFVESEVWASRVLGYLAAFYREQQQDAIRRVTIKQEQDAIRDPFKVP
jgi:hypothetical protein